MNHDALSSRDWLLLTVGKAAPKPLSPVQLQKCLFLLDRNLSQAQKRAAHIYAFQPYDYGPFDSSIYSDAAELAQAGLLEETRSPGRSYKCYRATDQGRTRAEAIAKVLPADVDKYATAVVEWTQRQSFSSLVSSIYSAYPDMKVNSVFKS